MWLQSTIVAVLFRQHQHPSCHLGGLLVLHSRPLAIARYEVGSLPRWPTFSCCIASFFIASHARLLSDLRIFTLSLCGAPRTWRRASYSSGPDDERLTILSQCHHRVSARKNDQRSNMIIKQSDLAHWPYMAPEKSLMRDSWGSGVL